MAEEEAVRGKSLYYDKPSCFVCGSPYVECHHIFGGVGRRPISDEEGCWIYLCHEHHQGIRGVHMDASFRDWLRADCQSRWEKREGLEGEEAHDEFRKRFGISYL